MSELAVLGLFSLVVVFFLALDLGVFNKKNHIISFKEALSWTLLWVSLAVGFYFFLLWQGHLLHGISNAQDLVVIKIQNSHLFEITGNFQADLKSYRQALSTEYITGYLLEYALSVDNIFVILLVFSSFQIEPKYFHKVLFWGILGAVVFRLIFIALGATLIHQFGWILYLFGLFLIYSGVMMFIHRNGGDKVDTENHKVVRWARKVFSVSDKFHDGKFFVRENGKTMITSLFIVLLVVEFSDIVFAVDSIPAIFGVTKDPYIVFFSNVFAILGLRSMFFLLMNVMHKFYYLKIGLSALLVFIGLKMLFHHFLQQAGFTTGHSLAVIAGILSLSIILSLLRKEKPTPL